MADDVLEFVLAIDEYKRINSRPFPTWSEVFEVMRYLGYRKVADRAEHIDRVTDVESDSESDLEGNGEG